MDETEVTIARRIAIQVHHGQVRWGGEDYFQSFLAPVADRARRAFSAREESLALLHEVLACSHMTGDLLIAQGISSDTVRSMSLLTQKATESYRGYIERVRQSEDAPAMRVLLLALEHVVKSKPPEHWSAELCATHYQRVDKFELAMLVLSEALARLRPHG